MRDLRTKHPRWGRNGLRDELLRAGTVTRVPSRSSIYRILVRRGLLIAGIPRAAMSPAASGGRTLEPATEGDF